jgi:hypothetical protein
MESLLGDLTEQIREIHANQARAQEDALQTRREHQHELHLLARLIRANRSLIKTESLSPAHQDAIDSKLEPALELKARKLRMRANAQQRSVSRKISGRKPWSKRQAESQRRQKR